MMPPICCLCGRESEGVDLVTFRETAEGREFERRARQEGLTGHPPDARWFCEEHLTRAKALAHLTRGEALERLRDSAT